MSSSARDEEQAHQLAAAIEHHAKDSSSSSSDPYLVAFSADHHDATNPLDWRTGKKWMVTDVLSATGFNRIMVSTIMAPALPTIAREFHMNPTEAAMSMSIYLLATALGPLVIGPLSEVYGRQVVLHGSSVWFLVWNVLCGFARTKETLIAARFLAGFGASAIYALGAGVLGDVWRPEQRGRSLGIYLLIPLLGAAVGMLRYKSHSSFYFSFQAIDPPSFNIMLMEGTAQVPSSAASSPCSPTGAGCSGPRPSSRPP